MKRLFFKSVRLGSKGMHCPGCSQPSCCAKGAHRTDALFSAVRIENMKKKMVVSVVVACFAHIPHNSWVEGHGIIQQTRQAPPWRRKATTQ